MRVAALMILSASVVQANQDDVHKMVEALQDEKVMEMVVDRLVDKLLGAAFTIPQAPMMMMNPVVVEMPLQQAPMQFGPFGARSLIAPKLTEATVVSKQESSWGIGTRLPKASDSAATYGKADLKVGPRNMAYADESMYKGNQQYTPEEKARSLKASDKGYEKLSMAPVEAAKAKAAANKVGPMKLVAQTDVIGTFTVALIGLVVFGGVALAVLRFRRSTLKVDQQPLFGA